MKCVLRDKSSDIRRGDVVIYDNHNIVVIVLDVTNIKEAFGSVQHEERYLVFTNNKIKVGAGNFMITSDSQYCGKAPE